MAKKLQKLSGFASLAMASTFVFAFWVFGMVLIPAGFYEAGADPAARVAVLADNQAVVSLSYLIAFVLFGALLVVLALGLYERLKTSALAKIATVFGLIWAALVIGSGMVANIGIEKVVNLYASDPAQAGTVWTAIESVQLGLGGGNEIIGGLWVLLISLAALGAKALPRALNYLGVGIGAAGLLTVVPLLEVVGAVEALGVVFGLGLIVWFVWVGVYLLRNTQKKQSPRNK